MSLLSFFKKPTQSPSEMSDEQLREALGKAFLKASRRVLKQEVVYGRYDSRTTEVDEIRAAMYRLDASDRELAVEFLTR